MLTLALLGLASALGALALVVILIRVHRSGRKPPTGSHGTATIEFALVFPLLLILILMTLQVMLAMVGNLYVNYAAYAATRAAIVQVPRDLPGEPSNVYFVGGAKHEAIRRAAAFALVPVSGRSNDGGRIDADGYVAALRAHFAAQGLAQPGWVDRLAGDRVRYADAMTQVTLYTPTMGSDGLILAPITAGHEFGPRDPITVRVTHRFNLSMPYVRVFFQDGRHDASIGGSYSVVTTFDTLTNEGFDTRLPEEPVLPRRP